MFGTHRNSAHVTALFASCFVAAAIAVAPAQAATQLSAKVPGNLKQLVLKLGADCHSAVPVKTDCGGNPFLIHYVDQHPKLQPKNYPEIRLVYEQAASICNSLRPSQSDGALNGLNVFWHKASSSLECGWGQQSGTTVKWAAQVSIVLPNPGQKLHQASCNDIDYNDPSYGCTPVAGGVQVMMPYDDISHFGGRVIDTATGYLEVKRWAQPLAAYNAHVGDDLGVFLKVGAALKLPLAED